ncbi:hypothetical protein [Thiopseudomonas alkaliphila]|uniref:Uncharacterized protein n=1 Tax=Thiopseudomonas alkaliphila TaxID=1697053 RepID=A0AAW7DUF7_9GAMM|nr:hypothetical protein [Thiopseudomonas alkaliphila]MDM1696613.1 hypothetical protein [Thiopseudomonas alkaliphila]MDM1715512.1 hypothetical protein [Thiopseudomonas alkaliphila]
MDNPLNVMTVLICCGMFLLTLGYSWREKGWGVLLMMIGMANMFGAIVYRIYLAIN